MWFAATRRDRETVGERFQGGVGCLPQVFPAGGDRQLGDVEDLLEVGQAFEPLGQHTIDEADLLAQLAGDECLEAVHPLVRLAAEALLADRALRVLSRRRKLAASGFDEAPRRLPHLPPGLAAGPRLRLVGEGIRRELVDRRGGADQPLAQLGDLRQRLVVEPVPGALQLGRELAHRARPPARRPLKLLAAVGGDRRLGPLQLGELAQLRLVQPLEGPRLLRGQIPRQQRHRLAALGDPPRQLLGQLVLRRGHFLQQAQRARGVLDRVGLGNVDLRAAGVEGAHRREDARRLRVQVDLQHPLGTVDREDELGGLRRLGLAGVEDVGNTSPTSAALQTRRQSRP